MIKTKAKYIIITLLFLFVIILFNTNTVNATTEEEVKKVLDLVPDEMYLDIPEIEYEKANDLIKEQAEKILKDNGIDTEKYVIEANQRIYTDIETFYKANIVLTNKEDNSEGSKNIKVIFNNTNSANSADEQYVKNLNFENPKYFETSIDYLVNKEEIFNWSYNYIDNYYNSKLTDKSVKISTFIGVQVVEGLNAGTGEGGIFLNVFRNGKLYDVKHIGNIDFIPVINISSSISDSEMKEYVINEVKKYYPDYAKLITDVKKGANEPNEEDTNTYNKVPDIYTLIIGNKQQPDSLVIIRKTDSSLQIKDETTNIKIDTETTVLPANTKLIVKELKEGETYKVAEKLLTNEVDKMYVYDITLQSEGVEVQPGGKVKVSIPIPEGLDTNKLVIYSINDNGTKTEYAVKVETVDNIKYATFETDHFSTYVLGEKAEEKTTSNTETTAKGEKDETPKTGATATIAGITALVILIGTVVIIKKCK